MWYLDEIAIMKQRLFCKNQKLDKVNFGVGPLQVEDDETLASQAQIIMLVAMNENWQLPVSRVPKVLYTRSVDGKMAVSNNAFSSTRRFDNETSIEPVQR
ncbi:hypothetical protein EVAR_41887_1 [Eumeta japonica]|uniref:Transposable element P transposase-like RNase H domain-containing protein n=1 Tax=Eumeta variegata TaxID=151549 RepID=A0A4C1YM62_EUMVA|nr:hypothetical protein EVAR_41887_1 [Eumeta japonica]